MAKNKKDDGYIILALIAAIFGMGRGEPLPSEPSAEAPTITEGPLPYAGVTPLGDVTPSKAESIVGGPTTADAPHISDEGIVTWPKPIWEEPAVGFILSQDYPKDVGQDIIQLIITPEPEITQAPQMTTIYLPPPTPKGGVSDIRIYR